MTNCYPVFPQTNFYDLYFNTTFQIKQTFFSLLLDGSEKMDWKLISIFNLQKNSQEKPSFPVNNLLDFCSFLSI